jgi:hypothetical protein
VGRRAPQLEQETLSGPRLQQVLRLVTPLAELNGDGARVS